MNRVPTEGAGQDQADDKETASAARERPSSDRWWENYVVRYLVGTVVGVFVVYALRESLGAPLNIIIPPFKGLTGGGAAVIGALGFGYCYIASTPVLAMHAARAGLEMEKAGTWAFVLQCALLLALFGLIVVFIHPSTGIEPQCRGWFIVGVVVLVQVAMLARAVGRGFLNIDRFYSNLVEARRREWKERGDFAESYRHLREHGNAVLIVILEILLGVALWFIEDPRQLVGAILIWLLPAATCWLFASILEARFAARKGDWTHAIPGESQSPRQES